MGWRWAQVAGLQSQEGDLLCTADVWEVADELTDAAASPVDGNAGWISVAEASVSRAICRMQVLWHAPLNPVGTQDWQAWEDQMDTSMWCAAEADPCHRCAATDIDGLVSG